MCISSNSNSGKENSDNSNFIKLTVPVIIKTGIVAIVTGVLLTSLIAIVLLAVIIATVTLVVLIVMQVAADEKAVLVEEKVMVVGTNITVAVFCVAVATAEVETTVISALVKTSSGDGDTCGNSNGFGSTRGCSMAKSVVHEMVVEVLVAVVIVA